MIDLRPNCVAQLKMNDNAASPWVAGLNGVPIEHIQNNSFLTALIWNWYSGWVWSEANHNAEITADTGWFGQNMGCVAGKKYLLVFTLLEKSNSPVVTPWVGHQAGTPRTANGTYAEIITCGADYPDYTGMVWFQKAGADSWIALDNAFCICIDDFPCTGVFMDAAGDPNTDAHTVAGLVGTALHYDAVDDYGEIFDEGALSFNSGSQDFSFAIWIKRAGLGVEYILDKRDDGFFDGWLLYLMFEKPRFMLNALAMTSDTAITDTNWHLIIVTVDRSANAFMYLDNVEVAGPLAIGDEVMDITNNLFIGQSYSGGLRFGGDIDTAEFFNIALSQAERDMLWHGGKGTERLISAHHHIYRGQDGNIDYSSSVAEMELDDSQVTVPDQALPPNTIWHYIRRQIDDECGLESGDSPVCVVAIDSNGDMIGDTPNPPLNLTIERLSNGRFRLRWRYTKLGEEVTPTGFKIYMDSGSGFNFSSPDTTITYGIGGIANEFSWISGALTHGQIYRFCVRSYRTGGGESQNTDYVATDADSQGPAAITSLRASYEEI